MIDPVRMLPARPSLRRLALPLLLLVPLLLQGCWTLEKYAARVRIEPDGGYKYFMEGTAVHGPTARALKRVEYDLGTGKAKAEDAKTLRAAAEAGLVKDLEEARKDPRVQSVTNIGGGRVRFMASGKASIAGGELIFNDANAPLTYMRAPGGTLSVRVRDAVVGREAGQLGLTVEGDVSVILGPGIEVLEHNAQRPPSGTGRTYRWRVEKPDEPAPHLVLRLPEAAAAAPGQGAGPAPASASGPAPKQAAKRAPGH